MNQAALRAETDQVIAELAAKRRDPDPVLVVQLNLAAKVAGRITAEFGKDAARAGRALVAASQALADVEEGLRLGGLPRRHEVPVLLNVLAFAGEITLHPEPGEPE